MTIIACARRKTDGLLTWAQTSPQQPDADAIIQKGINSFGGVADDWEYTELTPQQHDDLQAAMPGRSFLNAGALTSAAPPDLSAVPGSGQVTITCDVQDAAYQGAIAWQCIAPDGTSHKVTGAATNGVEQWIIETGQIGTYTVRVDVEAFGVAEIEFKEA